MSVGSKCKIYLAANNNNQVMVTDPLAAYSFNMNTNSLTRITDADFPGATTLDYSDGYFVISDNNARVSFSALGDGTSWDALDFFTPTFKPDGVRAIVCNREEVYCFGDETIEIYINDGSSPFIRQSRSSSYYGLTARHSIAVHQAGVFFLGKSRSGQSEAYLMGSNYSITPISTPVISQMLNAATNEDAEGFVLATKDGHILYHLHLPALNTTIVYDLTTSMWHERQSLRPYPDADGQYVNDVFRGRMHVNFMGMNLFGDWYSGKIFKEDDTVSTDDGNIRTLFRITPIFHQELKNIAVNSLEFDINAGCGLATGQGSAPIMMFQCSQDGGNTYEREEFIDLGAVGIYNNRVRINNLGTARNWTMQFSVSDPIDVIIMQAEAHGSIGVY